MSLPSRVLFSTPHTLFNASKCPDLAFLSKQRVFSRHDVLSVQVGANELSFVITGVQHSAINGQYVVHYSMIPIFDSRLHNSNMSRAERSRMQTTYDVFVKEMNQ